MQVPGLDRITFDPLVMGGQACIRGMRITGSVQLAGKYLRGSYSYWKPDVETIWQDVYTSPDDPAMHRDI